MLTEVIMTCSELWNRIVNTPPSICSLKFHYRNDTTQYRVLRFRRCLLPYHGQIGANCSVKTCLVFLLEKAVIRIIIFVVEYLFFNLQGNICQYITSLLVTRSESLSGFLLFINSNIFLSSDNFSLMLSFHIIFVCLFRVPRANIICLY